MFNMDPTGGSSPLPKEQGKAVELPSFLAAIAKTTKDGEPREDKQRGLAIVAVAKAAFENQKWVVREQIKCREMVNGRQWGYFDDRMWSWIPNPESDDDEEVRLVVNLIKPATDQMVAMLTRDQPQLGATGGANEIADTAAAEFATKVLTFDWRQDRLSDWFRLVAKDVSEIGEAWTLVQWNKGAGPIGKVGKEMVGEPTFDPMSGALTAMPSFQDKIGLQGKVERKLIPAENVACDPMARASDVEGLFIFIRERVSRAELRDRFPEKYGDLPPDNSQVEMSDPIRADRADRSSILGPPTDAAHSDDKEGVTLYTGWMRATEGYPRGYMAVVSDAGVICYEGDNEVYQREDEAPDLPPRVPWPLLRAICDPHSSSPRGRSRVLDAIEPQQAYNELISKEMEHYALMANTKVTLPAGLNVEWTDKIGQVIRVPRNLPMPAGSIGYLQPPLVPDYLTPAREFEAKIEKILGVNQSTQGQVPYSNTSGRAINAAAEKDETRIGPVKRALIDHAVEVMLLSLRFFRRYATYERQMLVAGENSGTALEFWSGAKLATCLDVVAYNDQMLPTDPTSKSLAIGQMAQTLGAIQDPALRVQMARLYGLRNFEAFISEVNRHDEKAERENRKIMSSEPVEVWEADDHLVHKSRIEDLILSEEFERRVAQERKNPEFQTPRTDPMTGMPVIGPDGQQVMDSNSPTFDAAMQHWQEHAQYLQTSGVVPGAMPMPGGGAGGTPPPAMQPVVGEATRQAEIQRDTTPGTSAEAMAA